MCDERRYSESSYCKHFLVSLLLRILYDTSLVQCHIISDLILTLANHHSYLQQWRESLLWPCITWVYSISSRNFAFTSLSFPDTTSSPILSAIQLLWMILATALLNVVWKQTALVDADKRSSHRVCSHYCVLDGGCEMQPFWCLEVLLEVLLFTPIIFIIHYIGDRCKYCSTESNQPNQKKDILDFILSQI